MLPPTVRRDARADVLPPGSPPIPRLHCTAPPGRAQQCASWTLRRREINTPETASIGIGPNLLSLTTIASIRCSCLFICTGTGGRRRHLGFGAASSSSSVPSGTIQTSRMLWALADWWLTWVSFRPQRRQRERKNCYDLMSCPRILATSFLLFHVWSFRRAGACSVSDPIWRHLHDAVADDVRSRLFTSYGSNTLGRTTCQCSVQWNTLRPTLPLQPTTHIFLFFLFFPLFFLIFLQWTLTSATHYEFKILLADNHCQCVCKGSLAGLRELLGLRRLPKPRQTVTGRPALPTNSRRARAIFLLR
jgi:hypothetical protein